jgi:excisionase family DNA binding protein
MARRRQTLPLTTAQPVQTQLLSIPEVATILRTGRVKVYKLIREAGLPSLQVGSVTRVSLASLQQWIADQEQAARPFLPEPSQPATTTSRKRSTRKQHTEKAG